ncbi:gliding motility-associated C-terminal domain-containing protein [Hymenobacter caeli]|uniref:Gliding motility-associated-like protein n=1 Tax=Hymenobacter caeli TaxID=2735894 RepID=A0ABX2FQH0_9BACT|nr:gliding motility-associated C-terminal domain-containing protein [Hymenobacter caeli]NRT19425.1 gliding motility-associated-like protein [Hymenobacter caeli]
MATPVLRRFWKWLPLLALLVLGLAGPARATHLLGGEMSYRYLDANGPAAAPFRYEIMVTIYNNALLATATTPAPAAPNATAMVGIYNRTTGAQIVLNPTNYPRIISQGGAPGFMDITTYTISDRLQASTGANCTVTGPTQPFRLQKFVGVVNLPVSFDGYYAVFTRSARNVDVTNLNTGNNNQPLTLYTSMAPALLPNHAPVFADTAVAIVCQGDTTISLNNAVDADGDRLVYSFGTPYGAFQGSGPNLPVVFPPLPLAIGYNPGGYSLANPLGTGPGNFALLNASTGVARYGAATQGKYVVAVDVAEYRTINGREVLIGTTRRDLQLVVAMCPATRAPVLPSALATPRAYTIEEGQALSIPVTATQPDGHPLVLTANSVLLDGAGGFNATFNGNAGTVAPGNLTGTATAAGTGTVTGTFVYNSACGDARATPYDVALTVKDTGCNGKIAADVLRITVTRAVAPTGLAGDAAVCPQTAHAYTVGGGSTPAYRWRVVGGTFVGSATGGTVQVLWGAAGPGRLVARGASAYGCLTDSVALPVTVLPAAALAVTGNLSVCLGASTTLAVAGGGGPYTLTGGGATQAGPGPFVVAPTQTTVYTLTGTAPAGGCPGTAQVTVAVLPLPVAVPGSAATICSGGTIQLGGPAVAGYAYRWSPATGLSNPAIANPTATLANATGAPSTTVYTLTVTSAASCTATGTVAVTVSPVPTVSAGPARTLCAGQTVALGAPAQAGFAYAWTPAAGLSSATAAQPVYTAANATNAPVVVKFRLVATTVQGCPARDSVLVTVNPLPPQRTITGPAFICDAAQAFTGTYAVAGASATATYQWTVVGGTLLSGQGTGQVAVQFASGAPARSLSVVETSAFGCTGTAASSLNILLDQPTIGLTTASVDATSNARVVLAYRVPNGGNTPNQVQVLRRVAGTGAFAVVGTTAPTATAFTDANALDANANSYEYQLSVANGCGTVLATAVAQTVRLQATATAGAGSYRQGSVALAWNPYVGFAVGGYRLYRRLDGGPAELLATVSATTLAYAVPNGAPGASSGAGFAQGFRVVAFSTDATPLLSNSNEATATFGSPLAFYNVITPNGDHRNDRLEIDNVALYPGNTLTIFNRWGREVYTTANYQNTWGDDASVAAGMYYYLFKLPNGTSTKGWVEVVK